MRTKDAFLFLFPLKIEAVILTKLLTLLVFRLERDVQIEELTLNVSCDTVFTLQDSLCTLILPLA